MHNSVQTGGLSLAVSRKREKIVGCTSSSKLQCITAAKGSPTLMDLQTNSSWIRFEAMRTFLTGRTDIGQQLAKVRPTILRY